MSPSTPTSPNSLMMSARRRSRGVLQQMADQRRLAGAEKAGDDGRRDFAARSCRLRFVTRRQGARRGRPARRREPRSAPARRARRRRSAPRVRRGPCSRAPAGVGQKKCGATISATPMTFSSGRVERAAARRGRRRSRRPSRSTRAGGAARSLSAAPGSCGARPRLVARPVAAKAQAPQSAARAGSIVSPATSIGERQQRSAHSPRGDRRWSRALVAAVRRRRHAQARDRAHVLRRGPSCACSRRSHRPRRRGSAESW